MATKIDTAGAYRGEIVEAALNVTTKSGYPQYVARLHALEKWVEEKEELEHFKNQGVIENLEPQWVDWSAFDEEIVGYFVLFKANIEQDERLVPGENDLPSYRQLKDALEWDGVTFDALTQSVGKKVFFRVSEEEYNGKSSLKATWIDHYDAPPQRELRSMDESKLKKLASLIDGGSIVNKPGKPAKPGKPVPAKPSPAKASSGNGGNGGGAKSAESDSSQPAAKPSATTASHSEQKSVPPVPKAKAKPEPEEQEVETVEGIKDAYDQAEAWEFLQSVKGDTSDSDIEDAWIAACGEVSDEGDGKGEADFTEQDWATVVKIVVRDLALNVA